MLDRSKYVNCHGLHNPLSNDSKINFKRSSKALISVSIICFVFMIAEIIGGIYSHSLGILTDAAHLLSDLAGFIIGIFALYLGQKQPSHYASFGYYRAEVLGAIITILIIWLLTGILVYESICRIIKPKSVDGKIMCIVAIAGLFVNFINGFILYRAGHAHSHGNSHNHNHNHQMPLANPADVNIHAAFIHILGDGVQSVGVVIAGALIWYNPKWQIADPICTFTFAILVLMTTKSVIKKCINVLMEAVPEEIDYNQVTETLMKIPNVVCVHDLHIWLLSLGRISVTVHVIVDRHADRDIITENVNNILNQSFNIYHATIQIEPKPNEFSDLPELVYDT
jgi:zinc transporter 2